MALACLAVCPSRLQRQELLGGPLGDGVDALTGQILLKRVDLSDLDSDPMAEARAAGSDG